MRNLLGFVVAMLAVAAVFTVPSRGIGQPPGDVDQLMAEKLKHSQQVLKGLCIEDFEMIANNAEKLSAISKAVSWNVYQTPEYDIHSAEFRGTVKDLSTAAKKRNLDGATLAYVQMTVKCVSCHKYVRGVRVAAGKTAPGDFDLQTAFNLLP